MSGAAGIPTVHGGEEVKSPRVEVSPNGAAPTPNRHVASCTRLHQARLETANALGSCRW
jgi:hypothetical protein